MANELVPTTATNSSNPDYECLAFTRMQARRKLPRVLMGGTTEIHKHKEYLPQHPAEDAQQYQRRFEQSVLRNFFDRTVQTLVGKVFSQPVITKDINPKLIDGVVNNIDLTGRNLHAFAREVFENAVIDGLSFILVDYPTTPTDLTLAEERQEKIRPYAVSIRADQVIGWRTTTIGDTEVLSEVRFKEDYIRTDPVLTGNSTLFGEMTYFRVRILRIGSWELWESSVNSAWEMIDSGILTVPFIPFIPIYTKRLRIMEANPPLEDLAYMNLEHFQIRSDQRNALSVASFPILAVSGWQETSDGKKVEFGPNKMMVSSDPNTKFYYVESAGAHLAAGERELKTLEDQMSLFGLQFEVGGKTAQSATGRAIDHAEGVAPLLAWTLQLEDAFDTMLSYMAVWSGMAADSGGSIEFNKSFGMSLKDQAEVEALLRTRAAGDLSRTSLLEEWRRRGVLPEEFDIEAETAKIEAEGPPLGNFTQRGKQGAGSPAPIANPTQAKSGNI